MKNDSVPTGTHILANCYDCDFNHILQEGMDGIKQSITLLVNKHGLTEVGNCYHSFGIGAFTGVSILAESHVSIHTWPEMSFVSIDVYVCNVTRDNSEAARNLYRDIEKILKPKSTKVEIIIR